MHMTRWQIRSNIGVDALPYFNHPPQGFMP